MAVLNTKEILANQQPSLSPEQDATAKPEAGAGLCQSHIATAAYFKAESRGFLPGYELDDWLDAEQELQAA